jgi:DNA modification methylase
MSTLTNHPNIEMIAPGDLTVASTHARRHSPKQIEQIARVIDRIGFIVPIIIDDDKVIAAGVGRREAAMLRNLELVPVIRVKFVSDADRRAFSLADNRLAELSDWDNDRLKGELEFLFEQDYDIDITGFDLGDLDLGVPTDEPEPPVELPDPDAKAVSRFGDKWLIGPHRLLCGNSRDAISYEALLGEERAAMVFSDPPYNVKIDGHVSGLGKIRHREFAEATGEMTPAEFTNFHRSVFRLCTHYSADGSIHYHCMDWRHIREILDAADGIYTEFKQLVVWVKSNAGMGTFYRSRHEMVFVFKSGRGRHINNFGLGDKGRYRTNVWEVEGANTFRKGRAKDLADHPTVKPVALVADAILDCSHRDDLILDPFSGSATTLLAAHRTHRRGAAIEIDPLHVDTGLRRLVAATGLVPTLTDGRTFEEVAAERANEEKIDG